MHNLRYVVINQEGAWRIKQAGRRFSGSYANKTQALCAAIEFAERDGDAGHAVEVLVRQEDDHFVTEWAYARDVHAESVARLLVMPAHRERFERNGE